MSVPSYSNEKHAHGVLQVPGYLYSKHKTSMRGGSLPQSHELWAGINAVHSTSLPTRYFSHSLARLDSRGGISTLYSSDLSTIRTLIQTNSLSASNDIVVLPGNKSDHHPDFPKNLNCRTLNLSSTQSNQKSYSTELLTLFDISASRTCHDYRRR